MRRRGWHWPERKPKLTQMVSDADGDQLARRGCAISSPIGMCRHFRRWRRHRTAGWWWCRWNPPRSPAASRRRWSCTARRRRAAGVQVLLKCHRLRRHRHHRRSYRRRCHRSPRCLPPVRGAQAPQDERLDHLAGRRHGAADVGNPRTRRLRDVARPRRLRNWADHIGKWDQLRITGGHVRRVVSAISLGIGLRFRRRPVVRLNTQQAGLAGRSATALMFHGREGRVGVGDSDWAARVPTDVAEPVAGARLRVEGV